MQFTITHHGVPVGTVECNPASERITVAVHPLLGYPAIRPVVRAASVALAEVALASGQYVETLALERGAELGRALELRDEVGTLVPVDYVELTEWPGGTPEVSAMLRLRDVHAAVPAPLRPMPREGQARMHLQPSRDVPATIT